MIKNVVCIVCPKGCRMQVILPENGAMRVEGNTCVRGEEYARQEMTQPQRVLTSTVKLTGGTHSRLPVKTNRCIPKTQMLTVMKLLDSVSIGAPVRCGDIIIANVMDLGVDIVATRDMSITP